MSPSCSVELDSTRSLLQCRRRGDRSSLCANLAVGGHRLGLAEVLVSWPYQCIAQESRTDMPYVRWNMNGAGCAGGRPDSSDKPPRMSLSYARTVTM